MTLKLNIQPAKRYQKKAKIALIGPSGSGKTMTALRLGAGLQGKGGKMLLLDTERSSATLYADVTPFDHADLPDATYETFMDAIDLAARAGYEVLIIDSASHAWESFLEEHDMESARTRNSFTAWAKITPKYNALINKIVSYPGHCIVTMRAKMDYVLEEKNGKQSPKKVGLAAVMRPGAEYEFDVVGLIDIDHNMVVEKTRFDWLADKIVKKPDEKLGQKIGSWLAAGATKEAPAQAAPKEEKSDAPKAESSYIYDLKQARKLVSSVSEWIEVTAKIKQTCGCEKRGNELYCARPVEGWESALVAEPVAQAIEDEDNIPEGFGNTEAA